MSATCWDTNLVSLKRRVADLEEALRKSDEEKERVIGEFLRYMISKETSAVAVDGIPNVTSLKLIHACREEVTALKKEKECLCTQLADLRSDLVNKECILVELRQTNEYLQQELKLHKYNSNIERQQCSVMSSEEHQLSIAPSRTKMKTKKQKHVVKATECNTYDSFIIESCNKVLNYLKKQSLLKPDRNGMIDIGNGVKVLKKKFDEIIQNIELSKECKTKKILSLVYSKEERVLRSLHGNQSRRFKGKPAKIPASPKKVGAILGCMKAQMLSQGQGEGPALRGKLEACRKAIGNKLADDGYNSNRHQ